MKPKSKEVEAFRVQVFSESGEWMTVLELPRQLPDDDGNLKEAFYWRRKLTLLDAVLNDPLL